MALSESDTQTDTFALYCRLFPFKTLRSSFADYLPNKLGEWVELGLFFLWVHYYQVDFKYDHNWIARLLNLIYK